MSITKYFYGTQQHSKDGRFDWQRVFESQVGTTHQNDFETVTKHYIVDYLSIANRDIMVTEDGSFTQRYVYEENGARISAEFGYAEGTHPGEGGENLQSDFAATDIRKVWYRTSHLGSTLFAVDADGEVISHTVYDPWGNPLTEIYTDANFSGLDNANNFTGYTWDEVLGLYFAQNRFYDAATHRFTQEDIVKDGGNWYVYCGNGPTNLIDPWGLKLVLLREFIENRGGSVIVNQYSKFGIRYGLKSITVSLYGKAKTYTNQNYIIQRNRAYIDDSTLIKDFSIDTTSYFTTLSCRFIYQSARPKGYNNDGTIAADMMSNDYSYAKINALHSYFHYQLTEDADTLFSEFESMATTFFARGELEGVILDMINHFREGSGTAYSNAALTSHVKEHSSTQKYMNSVKQIIVDALAANRGDLGTLNTDDLNSKIGQLQRPVFNTSNDKISGLTITINDTWGNTVSVKNYAVTGDTFSGTLNFNIYDHFGLDQPDVEKIYGNLAGFRAWFTLQHYTGFEGKYKPFVTEINIDIPFEGVIRP